jgi:hybrid cluster-associated redox disulfide protein
MKMKKNEVNLSTPIGEVLKKHPKAAQLMLKYGLHCIGCHVSAFETVEQGCIAHGLSNEQVKNLVEEINDMLNRI